MSAAWEIRYWPPPGYHVFLSHCAENRETHFRPVNDRLRNQKIIPWFDQDDYPTADDPYNSLRSNLILCRHVVYFITEEFLSQGRGWCAVERAYAELIQRHFQFTSSELWRFELPLVFLPTDDASLRLLQRSTWSPLVARSLWFEDRPNRGQDAVSWTVGVVKQLIQEQLLESRLLASRLKSDQSLQQFLSSFDGLRRRVTSRLPAM